MESCIHCVEKHLGLAFTYWGEARSGYAGRISMALGQLAAAEEEAQEQYQALATIIRGHRKAMEVDRLNYKMPWEHLLANVENLVATADPATRKMTESDARVATDAAETLPPPPEKGCTSCARKAAERAVDQAMKKRAKDLGDWQKAYAEYRDQHGEEALLELRLRHLKAELQSRGSTDQPSAERPTGKQDRPVDEVDTQPLLILLTALAGWDPSYSLASVILEQAKAGVLAGFEVRVVCMEHAAKPPHMAGVAFDPVFPFAHWRDDTYNQHQSIRIEAGLRQYLKDKGPCTVITHDLLLQSSYIDASVALHRIGQSLPGVRWVHQIHSSLGGRPTATVSRSRCTLPTGHKLCLVNRADVPLAKDYYHRADDNWDADGDRGPIHDEDIIILPNSRDLRFVSHMPSDAQEILAKFPLHIADVAQAYPLSMPRAAAKGLNKVIVTMGALKRLGASVRLLVINAHANGEAPAALMKEMRSLADHEGLTADEFAWSSEILPHTAVQGLGQQSVFSLLQASNLFCFPSISEAAGLVMLEAALAGNLLVLNRDLPVLTEYVPHPLAMWVDWGSIRTRRSDAEAYEASRAAAPAILQSLGKPPFTSKRHVLRRFGQEATVELLRGLLPQA